MQPGQLYHGMPCHVGLGFAWPRCHECPETVSRLGDPEHTGYLVGCNSNGHVPVLWVITTVEAKGNVHCGQCGHFDRVSVSMCCGWQEGMHKCVVVIMTWNREMEWPFYARWISELSINQTSMRHYSQKSQITIFI